MSWAKTVLPVFMARAYRLMVGGALNQFESAPATNFGNALRINTMRVKSPQRTGK
jgi:hypothetical protein